MLEQVPVGSSVFACAFPRAVTDRGEANPVGSRGRCTQRPGPEWAGPVAFQMEDANTVLALGVGSHS